MSSITWFEYDFSSSLKWLRWLRYSEPLKIQVFENHPSWKIQAKRSKCPKTSTNPHLSLSQLRLDTWHIAGPWHESQLANCQHKQCHGQNALGHHPGCQMETSLGLFLLTMDLTIKKLGVSSKFSHQPTLGKKKKNSFNLLDLWNISHHFGELYDDFSRAEITWHHSERWMICQVVEDVSFNHHSCLMLEAELEAADPQDPLISFHDWQLTWMVVSSLIMFSSLHSSDCADKTCWVQVHK